MKSSEQFSSVIKVHNHEVVPVFPYGGTLKPAPYGGAFLWYLKANHVPTLKELILFTISLFSIYPKI